MDIHNLLSAARAAIRSQDNLLEAWRNIDTDLSGVDLAEVKSLMCELIKYRIYPVHAYKMLTRIDRDESINILINMYVGKNVDPDTKFGGHTYDLSSMLEDLVESHGEEAIKLLVRHKQFERASLRDHRFVQSVCDALSADEDQVIAIINSYT